MKYILFKDFIVEKEKNIVICMMFFWVCVLIIYMLFLCDLEVEWVGVIINCFGLVFLK